MSGYGAVWLPEPGGLEEATVQQSVLLPAPHFCGSVVGAPLLSFHLAESTQARQRGTVF